MSTIATAHIEIDENGVAWIDDTRVKVIEVVIDKIATGSSPEELHFQYPHLSLAQIHAALAHYYDNQTVLDAEIERRWRESDELARKISDTALRQKLLTLKEARTGIQEVPAVIYRRGKGHDTWHWCKNCSTWPTKDYEESSSRPTAGEFCNECHAKQSSETCHQ